MLRSAFFLVQRQCSCPCSTSSITALQLSSKKKRSFEVYDYWPIRAFKLDHAFSNLRVRLACIRCCVVQISTQNHPPVVKIHADICELKTNVCMRVYFSLFHVRAFRWNQCTKLRKRNCENVEGSDMQLYSPIACFVVGLHIFA